MLRVLLILLRGISLLQLKLVTNFNLIHFIWPRAREKVLNRAKKLLRFLNRFVRLIHFFKQNFIFYWFQLRLIVKMIINIFTKLLSYGVKWICVNTWRYLHWARILDFSYFFFQFNLFNICLEELSFLRIYKTFCNYFFSWYLLTYLSFVGSKWNWIIQYTFKHS